MTTKEDSQVRKGGLPTLVINVQPELFGRPGFDAASLLSVEQMESLSEPQLAA
jgi:hypothetical protein